MPKLACCCTARVVFAVAAGLTSIGCNSNDASPPAEMSGGGSSTTIAGAKSTGGNTTIGTGESGGSPCTGGSSATRVSEALGGGSATGGTSSSVPFTYATVTAGATSMATTPGGAAQTGGFAGINTSGTANDLASGGAHTGGAIATGGSPATGGTPARSSLASDRVMTTCETPEPAVQTQRIEAECAFGPQAGNCKGTVGGQQGTQPENDSTDVSYIEAGDYVYYEGVVMTGITALQIRYAKGQEGGSVEVHLDSSTGQTLATITPASTGSWSTWADASAELGTAITGTHTLYFVFKAGNGGILNLDWFQVSAGKDTKAPVFHLNQVGFDTQGAKHAVVESPTGLTRFHVVTTDGNPVWCGDLTAQQFDAWGSSNQFYSVDFTELTRVGTYRLQIGSSASPAFSIGDNRLFATTFPSVLRYFRGARADDADVWAADERAPVFGTSNVVDARGGWYDASGDISKYLTHLSYTNFMLPQQTPLVAWALAWVYDQKSAALATPDTRTALQAEALWGADYLLRVLDPQGYFYATVFDNWSGNVAQRQICAFTGDSGSVSGNYQSAMREGGGMSIAALARVARWKADSAFTSSEYLEGAKRAFAFLNANGVQFADDGKENIIDDYTGLLAASELYAATEDATILDAARARASSLIARLGPDGYFIADDNSRPFWHASDAGLPVVALVQYLKVETDPARRTTVREAIRTHLGYLVRVTRAVVNPYGYARQPTSATTTGFFIPQDNESGYWWQGENARLASLAAAALLGANALDASSTEYLDLLRFAGTQIDWVLGANPYDLCFLKGFGSKNPEDFCSSKPQWESLLGGIANGITGAKADGSGIQFAPSACWDNWRWVEQWIPHAAWYLVAVASLMH